MARLRDDRLVEEVNDLLDQALDDRLLLLLLASAQLALGVTGSGEDRGGENGGEDESDRE
jgi:hypothetical protein